MNKINHTIKNITNSGLEQVSFKKGTTIYKVNEKPKFAYYVYTGKVNIISKDEYNIGIIQEGELFGEISSLFNKEHSVSASAAEDCRLLIIEKDVFFNKVESADPILKAVIRTLSLRLNDSNKKSEEIWKQLHLLSSIKKDIEKA
jgi:CRP-like cAMP-binding protein